MTGRKRSKIVDIAERSLREGRLEGIIDAPKSGRWGDWVYYMRGKTQCCRRYVVPRDARTPAQLRCRAALSAASKAWSESRRLTEEQRQACRSAGAKMKTQRRLGQRGTQTGQLYFVGRECAGRRNVECGLQNGTTETREKAEGRTKNAECCGKEVRRGRSEARGSVAGTQGSNPMWRGGRWRSAGRRMCPRSTWDEYRVATASITWQYRWGTRARRLKVECRLDEDLEAVRAGAGVNYGAAVSHEFYGLP